MKKRKHKKEPNIRAIGIRRKDPDLRRLALALIELAEEELKNKEAKNKKR